MEKLEVNGKINFVDENNVFVSYNLKQQCCEHAGWFISKEKPKTISRIQDFNFDGSYIFDENFFEESILEDTNQGGSVLFRFIGKNSEAFLCLYNCQDGYSSHSFIMEGYAGQTLHHGFL